MERVIEFLNVNNTKYDIGIIKNNYFYKLPKAVAGKCVIRFKWKSNSVDKLVSKLKERDVILSLNVAGEYNALYDITDTDEQVLVVYAVDSHVQLPKVILKNFRTGDNLYFLDTNNDEIIRGSARRYNTEFGYYSLFFENYLSNNYESMIEEIINNALKFINEEVQTISFKSWDNNINKLFFMSTFRSPKQVEEIRKRSLFAKFFTEEDLPEQIAYIGEEMNENFIKGYRPVPIVNRTEKGIVSLKSLVANLYIDGGVEAMVMPLHPKFAVALVPGNYYEHMLKVQGQQTYILMDKEQEVLKLNRQIYNTAEFHNEDVIGIMDDLEDLKKIISQV